MFETKNTFITFDFGYAGGEKNGHNHSYIGTSVNYTLTKNAAISAIFEQTFGGSVIKKEGKRANQLWMGIHYLYSW